MLEVYMHKPVPCAVQNGVQCTIDVWPSDAGILSDGHSDYEKFEASIVVYELYGGKDVFKSFWRWLRMTSKKRGGFNVFSCYFPDMLVPLP